MKIYLISYLFLLLAVSPSFCQLNSLRLFTQSNRVNYYTVTASNINSSPFLNTRKTYFIIHGWRGAASDDWMSKIKDNILSKENANVFLVDWSTGASTINYLSSASSARTTGTSLGQFIVQTSMNANNIHCIGHSLGAHLCGFAGKTRKLARITGMDPAGPDFKGYTSDKRLSTGDANLVDCIHTDGTFGIQDPIGHKNFYPNGGSFQTGCPSITGKRALIDEKGDLTVDYLSCSHSRVMLYYAESVTSTCRFSSIKCNSYSDFQNNRCSCSSTYGCASMGHYANVTPETGSFYLNTKGAAPYCMS